MRLPARQERFPFCETAWLEIYITQLSAALVKIEADAKDHRRRAHLRERDRARLETGRIELHRARRELRRRKEEQGVSEFFDDVRESQPIGCAAED